MTKQREKLIEVKNVKQHFDVSGGVVKAVNDISFDIYRGETFGLVGESGCGKSTTGRTIIRLYDATAGEVLFDGENVHGKKSRAELKKFNRKMQMIFPRSIRIIKSSYDSRGILSQKVLIFTD